MRNIKKKIRKEISDKLKRQAKRRAFEKSERIKKKLFSSPEFKKARVLMLYASQPEEVNTSGMIKEALEMGKRVALPRCTSRNNLCAKEIKDLNEDLEKGTYGLFEPRKQKRNVNVKRLDLIVVPGIAFDRKKGRLGRGKGYYDRFLRKVPGTKTIIGLAFDFQIVKDLPADSHDIPVSRVITD